MKQRQPILEKVKMPNGNGEKLSPSLIFILTLLILVLSLVNAGLFVDNLRTKKVNKQLILQNDSLFSSSPHIQSTLDTLKKKSKTENVN